MTAKELCDSNSNKFKGLKTELNLSNDDFIRTTDQKKHWPSAQKIWEKLEEK
jgi:methionyl-tRNA synthetase